MSIWALKKAKHYRREFGDQVPKNRKAMFPFVFWWIERYKHSCVMVPEVGEGGVDEIWAKGTIYVYNINAL